MNVLSKELHLSNLPQSTRFPLSLRQIPSIHRQRDPGHPRRVVARQEQRRPGDVVLVTPFAPRRARHEARADARVVEVGAGHCGFGDYLKEERDP